jgi:choline-phosphate cytidylyltransferase
VVKVITYGTFDLFHEGHRRLLERAKALGDYLIVGVTSDAFDEDRGKLNVQQPLMERIANVQGSGLVDEILVEEFEGQKVQDIQRRRVDIFAIGSDWAGQFDYLKEYCEVIYLERTRGVSSTQLRDSANGILRLGVLGTDRAAREIIEEARFVSGVNLETVLSDDAQAAQALAEAYELQRPADSWDEAMAQVDAVVVSRATRRSGELMRMLLRSGLHVLAAPPLASTRTEAEDLFRLGADHDAVLLELIKTAFLPGFQRLLAVVKSGAVGEIQCLTATCTGDAGPLGPDEPTGDGEDQLLTGAAFPLLAAVKLVGVDPVEVREVRLSPPTGEGSGFARLDITFPKTVVSLTMTDAARQEATLCLIGTRGYLRVPEPWWNTEYFETHFPDRSRDKRYFYKCDGPGLRYAIAEFARTVRAQASESYKLRQADSVAIADLRARARAGRVAL